MKILDMSFSPAKKVLEEFLKEPSYLERFYKY